MATKCLNCEQELSGKFCINCGQTSSTHKITAHFLWHDVQHGLLHFDKGFLYTTKELFTRPGYSIRAFIEGKRISHFKPISFVLILAGLYGFLSHYFHVNLLSNNFSVSGTDEEAIQATKSIEYASEWIASHYSVISLLLIPVFSIGTYFAFRSKGFNVFEHFVINAYLAGQRLVLHILTFPVYYIFKDSIHLKSVARSIDMIGYLFMAWSLFQLFDRLGPVEKTFRIILSFIISFSIEFIILLLSMNYIVNSIK